MQCYLATLHLKPNWPCVILGRQAIISFQTRISKIIVTIHTQFTQIFIYVIIRILCTCILKCIRILCALYQSGLFDKFVARRRTNFVCNSQTYFILVEIHKYKQKSLILYFLLRQNVAQVICSTILSDIYVPYMQL